MLNLCKYQLCHIFLYVPYVHHLKSIRNKDPEKNLSYNEFADMIFLTLGFKLENLSRTLKRFEGVCPTNLLDFSELGTFGLAKWQRDMVTTLKKVHERTGKRSHCLKKKKLNLQHIEESLGERM